MNLHDDKLIKEINSALNESTNTVDRETRYKLATARQKALSPESRRTNWLPLTGVAFASIVALSVITFNGLQWQNSPIEALPSAMLVTSEDIEMMSVIPDPELLEELEFYLWLEQRDQNAA